MKRLICGTAVLFSFLSFSTVGFAPSTEPFKQEFLSRINAIRTQGCNCGDKYMPPVEPLVWNENLELSAYNHAYDMASNRYFSHYSRDGKRLRDRAIMAGYTFDGFQSYRIGENIAQGQRSLKEVMNDWIKSPTHCNNLMDPNFREVGVSVINSYWVQDFGVRQPFMKNSYSAKN